MRNNNTPLPPSVIEEMPQGSQCLSFVCLLLRCVFNVTVLIGLCDLLVAYVVAKVQHIWYYPTQSFWHLLITNLLDVRVIGLGLLLVFLTLSQDH